ncbi:MAG: hypothetical protein LBM16_01065 [Clostridiales bacterium]|nr:hypothetical protein [Clostridiales bacterium]
MDSFTVATILRQFSLKCLGFRKEKSYYICKTDKGTKCLRPTPASVPQLLFAHNIQERLSAAGFESAERFSTTEQGMPYTVFEGEYYIAADCRQSYRETDFSSKEDVLAAVSALGRMHSALKSSGIISVFGTEETPEEEFGAVKSLLNECKRVVRRQTRLSDFDVLFLKNLAFYENDLSDWLEISKSEYYRQTAADAVAGGYICHNLLKEETILLGSDGAFIVNFLAAAPAHFINDIADVIKRHSKKTVSGGAAPIEQILEQYTKYNPLSDNEVRALYAPLIFPDKFLSLCRKYYSKKRTWIPGAFLTKMESITELHERQKNYIDDFFTGII